MTSTAGLRALFSVPRDNPGLMRSQIAVLSRQIPLLYLILVVNLDILAFTFHGLAPDALTVGFPILLTVACLARGFAWMRMRRRTESDAVLIRRLRRTVVVTVAAGVLYLAWALALFPYGDPYAQGQVAFCICLTVISCIFCLMHLRPAALTLTGVVMVPAAIFFISTGRPALVAMAINIMLVSAAMVYVLIIYSRDFASMVNFQQQLVATHLETERLNEENSRLANLDSLTDLPNRRLFFAKLEEAQAGAQRAGGRFIVGLIDLDGFKAVNDVYGHTTGDRLLVEAGLRMRAVCEGTIFLARLGGDEFGLLVAADWDDAAVRAFGSRLCAALDAPFNLRGIIAQVAGSIGFATYPEAGASVEQLFERADYALYHAKQHARGRPVIFSAEQETQIRHFSNVEQCLRHADLEAELAVHFQPIVDVDRNAIVMFEALARWHSPRLGRVPPDVFIRVAERSDLVNKLTQTLLRKTLVWMLDWPADLRVSFNLSVRDLIDDEALLAIVAIIRKSGVDPRRIDLEVTETALRRDFDQTSKALRLLKALGAGVSLDDFGTGYSSLSYVHRLPIDKIKIDRSFIKDVESDKSCRAIVKTVIDMCRNLELACIIEGMETDAQAAILRELGCTTMQGYLFGKPMPAADVLAFLAAAGHDARAQVAEAS
jgi:diguanylate cyclase (GGDEF)-like protein